MVVDDTLRRRKLWFWAWRQAITITLALLFWEHGWVRMLFAMAMVLALFQLAMLLFVLPRLLARAQRARERLEDLAVTEDGPADTDNVKDP